MMSKIVSERIASAALFVVILPIITSIAYGSPQHLPRFWGKLNSGKYDVGLSMTTFMEDASTRFMQGRSIQITIWYPASPSKHSGRMSLADYLKLSNTLTETSDNKTSDAQYLRESLSLFISSEPDGIDNAVLDEILNTKMFSVRDAVALKKAFPLILWSARHGTILGQSVLCEYLASHGYVVAFARYDGPAMPLPYETNIPEVKANTLKAHVSDLEFALKRLKTLPNVARDEKTAVISWSYAGESATLLQMQSPEVSLVISLSSNVLSGWVYQSADSLSKLDAAKLNVPYVLMTERVGTNGAIRTAPSILDTLPNKSYFISFAELSHGNFNVTEGMIPGIMGISKVPRWSKSGPLAQTGYETISRYALHFLDAYLKTNGKPANPLADWNWDAGLPQEFVTITQHGTIQ